MADNDVFHAVFFEHGGGNFTRIGAFFRKVYVFRAELDIRSFKSFAYSGNVDRGDAYDASLTSGAIAFTRATPSDAVLFIFQLPAMIGFLIRILLK